jgi:anion-transporting  ArsA/GET3 family ATPase
MVLDALLERRVVFLSGKGGVGKSVVGAALALAARERGKRVLLVEIEAPLEAARYLGAPPVGPVETEVLPGLFTVNLNPDRVMEEYVQHTVHVRLLARKILDSPIYQRFFAAAPGLPELMLLGKVMVLEQAARRGKPLYDLILVDAPATGHGLAFLKVPLAASDAIPVGPVGNNARRILSLLRDARKTALAIVTLPEEMAAIEAVQFHRLAVDEVGIAPAAVFLNACHERRFSDAEEAEILRLGAEGAGGRLGRGVPLSGALVAARHQIRLRRALPLPLVSLPFLYQEEIGPDALRALAARIEAA